MFSIRTRPILGNKLPAACKTMYSTLVLSGGSIFAAAFIGAIHVLEQDGAMSHIRHVVGTSAGSMVALLVALGFSSVDMQAFFLKYLKTSLTRINPEALFEWYDTMGLSDGENIRILARAAIQDKLGSTDLTFLDLAKRSGKNLAICVSNVTRERSEYWDVDSTPHMSVIQAVKTSCAIPILFQPTLYNECIYLDGGLFNHFPMGYCSGKYPFKDALGIILQPSSTSNAPSNGIELLRFLCLKLVNKINADQLKEDCVDLADTNVAVLTIHEPELVGFNLAELRFEITEAAFLKYIAMGQHAFQSIWQARLKPQNPPAPSLPDYPPAPESRDRSA